MKKILTLPTVIVFFITILFAGGCGPDGSRGMKRVKIHLVKAYEEDGVDHLKMYDSNDPDNVVIDSLVTDVQRGTKVIWKLDKDSGIKKIEKIGPRNPGKLITGDAKKIPFTKKFKLEIPDNAPVPSERKKYDILLLTEDGKTKTIDPYLRLPNI